MKRALWSLIKTNTDCMMSANSARCISYFKGKIDAYLVILVAETSCSEKEYDVASRIVDMLYKKKMLFYT